MIFFLKIRCLYTSSYIYFLFFLFLYSLMCFILCPFHILVYFFTLFSLSTSLSAYPLSVPSSQFILPFTTHSATCVTRHTLVASQTESAERANFAMTQRPLSSLFLWISWLVCVLFVGLWPFFVVVVGGRGGGSPLRFFFGRFFLLCYDDGGGGRCCCCYCFCLLVCRCRWMVLSLYFFAKKNITINITVTTTTLSSTLIINSCCWCC